MERNPWKLATIGTGPGRNDGPRNRPHDCVRAAVAGRCAGDGGSSTRCHRAPRPLGTAHAVTRPAASPVAPRVTPVATTPAATAECTAGDRAMRIAKPGVIGGLLGAGLGAAGGAVADGGSGAGKGALIGGLAGTVLGGGYGAYQTKNECGTIFGNTFGRAVRRTTPRAIEERPGVPRGATSARRGRGPLVKRPRTVSRGHLVSLSDVRAWYRWPRCNRAGTTPKPPR